MNRAIASEARQRLRDLEDVRFTGAWAGSGPDIVTLDWCDETLTPEVERRMRGLPWTRYAPPEFVDATQLEKRLWEALAIPQVGLMMGIEESEDGELVAWVLVSTPRAVPAIQNVLIQMERRYEFARQIRFTGLRQFEEGSESAGVSQGHFDDVEWAGPVRDAFGRRGRALVVREPPPLGKFSGLASGSVAIATAGGEPLTVALALRCYGVPGVLGFGCDPDARPWEPATVFVADWVPTEALWACLRGLPVRSWPVQCSRKVVGVHKEFAGLSAARETVLEARRRLLGFAGVRKVRFSGDVIGHWLNGAGAMDYPVAVLVKRDVDRRELARRLDGLAWMAL